MSSRAVVLVLLVELLGGLASVPEEQNPDSISIDVTVDESDPNMMMSSERAERDTSVEPYSTYSYDYQMMPSDSEKTFGGDRSDEFLYPPYSYYKQWADEERDKDNDVVNC